MTEQKLDHCLVFRYDYKMTGVDQIEPLLFFKKFMYKQTELFRAGMKMTAAVAHHYPNPPAILFLLTTGLEKMGLKVSSVSYQKWSLSYSKEIEMEENILSSNENNNKDTNGEGGTQLFTASLKLFENADWSPQFTVKFNVHLIGTVDNFCLHQMDHLLSEQLWSSITDQEQGTTSDFKLIASDGNGLPVHKWILAARSPVFADLFSGEEDVKSIHLAGEYNLDEMKKLVKFICTGELEGMVTENLKQLAMKYRIKTLEDLCQTARQDSYSFSADKMTEIAIHMESGSHRLCNEINDPDEEFLGFNEQENLVSFQYLSFTWNLENLDTIQNREPIEIIRSFEYEGKELFRAGIDIRKSPNQANKKMIMVKFLSYGHNSFGDVIDEVICYVGQEQESSTFQQIELNKSVSDDGGLLEVFTNPPETELDNRLSSSFFVTFRAKLRGIIPNFINKPVDSAWSKHLWAAAVNRKMTDVEFLVGEETFGAHRSLLSARSPVFAAMFASGMKEVSTGQVRIEDVDPTTFIHFLKFLYIGMVEPSSVDRDLFVVADKYGVETLMELCRRSAAKTVELDDHIF